MTSGSVKASGWLWRIGIPVSATWLMIIWLLVLLNMKFKINLWYYIGFALLLSIPGSIITNYVCDVYTNFSTSAASRSISTISSVAGMLTLAGICFIIGFNRRKK
jgi:uncharacterized membrane protein YjjP (DUF1212 family)